MTTPQQDQYLGQVLRTLSNNPTAAELDYLIEAFTTVGYLAADAEGLAEAAENTRKYEEAQAYLASKSSGEKVTERYAEANAALAVRIFRDAEVEARVKARKVKNLQDALEQAINAIKFLGRVAG